MTPPPFLSSFLLALAVWPALLLGQPATPEVLFEEGYYQEVAAADGAAALRAYRAALDAPGISPRLAARAHFRLGLCLELQGEDEAAQGHFAAAAAIATADPEIARAVRRHLRLPPPEDPARYMPPDVLLYAELVEPRHNVQGLSALLAGTPFQNPVDYYLSYQQADDSRPPPSASATGQVREAAAFLNENFLRELEKVQAVALAIPGERRTDDDFIAVLLPGASNIIRGLVHLVLTLSQAPLAGRVRDISIFRLEDKKEANVPPESRIHVAVGPDVILLGKPLRLVEEAAARGPGGAPALADDAEFQKATAARSGSFVFSFLRAQRVVEAWRAASAAEPAAFEAIHAGLGLAHLVSGDIALARVDEHDALRLEARVRLTAEGLEAWKRLGAPALDSGLLGAIPQSALAFIATKIEDGAVWVEALEASLPPLQGAVAPAEAAAPRDQSLRLLLSFFREGEGKALLGQLRGFALGIAGGEPEQGVPPYFAVFEMRDPEKGRVALEAACAGFFSLFLHNSLPRAFRDAPAGAGGPVPAVLRSFEALPGVHLLERQVGGAFLLSASPRLLEDAAAAHGHGATATSEPFFPGAGKTLFLRPAALVAAPRGRSRLPAELQLLCRQIPRVLLATREAEDSVSLEVVVPEITPTVRKVLTTLAEAMRKSRESQGSPPPPEKEP